LKYAALARGYFPGDYIGTAISQHLLYVVRAVSSEPPASSTSPYHQVIWGSTLSRVTRRYGATSHRSPSPGGHHAVPSG